MRLAVLLLVALVLAQPARESEKQKQMLPPFPKVFTAFAPVIQCVMIGKAAVCFATRLSPDDFFSDLERVETPQGPEFRKGAQVVKSFPGRIVLGVSAGSVGPCADWSLRTFYPSVGVVEADFDLMNSLWFELRWERAGQLRPVGWAYIQVFPPRMWREFEAASWHYDVTIGTREVPLTDNLVVAIRSKEGKKIATFTSALGQTPAEK